MSATVRAARVQDAAALVPLFAQWDHPQPEPFVAERMAAAEERGRAWGCDRLELTSSRRRDAAMAFYAALGFEDWCPTSARFVREL